MKSWHCICGCGRKVGGIYHNQKCRDKVLLEIKEENRAYQDTVKTKAVTLARSNLINETVRLMILGLLWDSRWSVISDKNAHS